MPGNYLPTIKALVEINRGNTAKAVEILETARPYELGSPSNISMSPAYIPFMSEGSHICQRNKALRPLQSFKRLSPIRELYRLNRSAGSRSSGSHELTPC